MKKINSKTFEKLKQELIAFSGYKVSLASHSCISLGPIDQAFPNHIFPVIGTLDFRKIMDFIDRLNFI
jgi:hypothetical protein